MSIKCTNLDFSNQDVYVGLDISKNPLHKQQNGFSKNGIPDDIAKLRIIGDSVKSIRPAMRTSRVGA
jgi:hypothetical protein